MTILASSAASISSTFFHYLINGYLEPQATCNGILSGLVAVTAGCATSNATGAVLTGLVAGPLYLFSVHAVETYLKVDDVCHAVAVHGANGVWGLIAAALFATPWYYNVAYDYDRGSKCAGLFYGGGGRSLGAALVFPDDVEAAATAGRAYARAHVARLPVDLVPQEAFAFPTTLSPPLLLRAPCAT